VFADVAGRVPVIRAMSTSVSIAFELLEE